MNEKELILRAIEIKKNSYSPYSDFAVGAALLCADGEVFTGVNVENVSFGLTNCAERTAFFKAVSEGKRTFEAIAIVGKDTYLSPCGACRQVMAEFCDENFRIIFAKNENDYIVKTLGEILPFSFTEVDMK
ncbi:MAG: cytidine deaminase [Ruminococcaceae bacterium]|nr:cytidine deaminase [Oscillospiraceae bacterium]